MRRAPDNAARREALRSLLAAGAALSGLPLRAQTAAPAGADEPPRLALLIGNRDYPDKEDLPPIHKNVRDLQAALQQRGFEVTAALDLDFGQARSALDAFATRVRAAPPEATVLFYFSGHGAQVDSENLLVSAGVSPRARPDTLIKGSVALRADVVNRLQRPAGGLTIAVVDACRSPLINQKERDDGLNQVEAPPGCLIAFSTGAGKYAIAPDNDEHNTFYTGSLVKLLGSASDETSFSDLFRLVKFDVQETMLKFPVPVVRTFAQFPFIAENTQVRRPLSPHGARGAAQRRFGDADEADEWIKLEGALWPADVARLAGDFLKHYPASKLAGSALVAREGAVEAAKVLRRGDVKLFRSAFDVPEGVPPQSLVELHKAGRGDKDAAARIGHGHGRDSGRYDLQRFEGWMQYAAVLGNGIASYALALHYRRENRPNLAAQYEARARVLGYTPPPSLDNTRK